MKKGADINIDKLARSTTGCTGADLENLVNQAALKAVMDGDSSVTMIHMEFARDKILMGLCELYTFMTFRSTGCIPACGCKGNSRNLSCLQTSACTTRMGCATYMVE